MTDSLQTLGFALLALLVLAAVARGCIERKRQRWMEAIEREQWRKWERKAQEMAAERRQ